MSKATWECIKQLTFNTIGTFKINRRYPCDCDKMKDVQEFKIDHWSEYHAPGSTCEWRLIDTRHGTKLTLVASPNLRCLCPRQFSS